MAGVYHGHFKTIRLLIYPDSTYYYSRSIHGSFGRWEQIADSLILIERDTIQAILVDKKAIQINNPNYDWLRDMRYVKLDTPETIVFPKNPY